MQRILHKHECVITYILYLRDDTVYRILFQVLWCISRYITCSTSSTLTVTKLHHEHWDFKVNVSEGYFIPGVISIARK
jgi:hypothetical protein